MLNISIDQENIDLPDNFMLDTEENNPLFTLDGLTDGSFCYTTTLPYTPKNARLANYPQRLETAYEHIFRKPCQIYQNQVLVESGMALFTKSTDVNLDFAIGIGESAFVNLARTSKLKDGNYGIREVDMFHVTEILFLDRKFPQYDFCFPMVRNDSLTDAVGPYWGDVNFINISNESFFSVANLNTPHIFVFYLMKFWASSLGYSLQFNIDQDDERLQTVLNVPTVFRAANETETIDLKDYVPDISVLDLFVAFKKTSLLQFFIDERSKTIIVDDIRNIKKWPISDISKMVKKSYEEDHSEFFSSVLIKRLNDDSDNIKESIDLNVSNYIGAFLLYSQLPDPASEDVSSVCYCIDENQYYKIQIEKIDTVTIVPAHIDPSNPFHIVPESRTTTTTYENKWISFGLNESEHSFTLNNLSENKYEVELQGIIGNSRAYFGGSTDINYYIPTVKMQGNFNNLSFKDITPTEFIPRFLLYRGLFYAPHKYDTFRDYGTIDFATNSVYNPYSNEDEPFSEPAPNFKESYLFTDIVIEDGVEVDYGLYKNKLKELLAIILNKRVFSFYLNVETEKDFRKLRFNSIMEVNGSHFLIKSKKYSRTNYGIADVRIDCIPLNIA